ncbi:Di-and tricarboxylate transporter [Paracoccus halophilus]|uniref:Di-and tricarboxylate transporter n=1 Tax=Paracoccus halophilus TaxID=376733 RepID=A0A099F4K6_9RHOB|nr:SLC13 family permease [Paracoccus halophilus]KGJ05136.1 potassium transporter TrkA [Paracoccus halophilus]SFA43926.1 Di-and tricarboxylate transporter [Paracoccus halophilus]
MTQDQIALFSLFAVLIALLIWGRWRHDIVAVAALMAAVLLGLVPADRAFTGFGHPAVITVALVLVVSAGLMRTGAVHLMGRYLARPESPVPLHLLRLGGAGAALSGVMNNVTALALMMPLDLQTARKAGRSAALTLMPLAFLTILGGMVTLIGTPPNLIISGFRAEATGKPFRMFDFTPVGGAVALAGLAFVALFGWRLLPRREDLHEGAAEKQMREYVAELVLGEDSRAEDMTRAEIEAAAEKSDATLVAITRRGRRVYGLPDRVTAELGDILLFHAVPAALEELRLELGLSYPDGREADAPLIASEGQTMIEVVVANQSRLRGRTARQVRLGKDYDSVLLGIIRQGRTIRARLRDTQIEPGDILLLLVPEARAAQVIEWLHVMPLDGAEPVIKESRVGFAIALFVAALAAVSLGWITMPIALGLVLVGYVLGEVLTAEELYDHVDWPVIVLLGALIPLGLAMETTGASGLIAGWLARMTDGMAPWVALTGILVATMFISDVLNNNATAILAAPVALSLAEQTGTNPDTYLMAIAVGASCAFLTPIGHQNNTIVMGPGGYRFSDYWRMGLPLEIIVTAVAVPMLLIVWPL